MAAARLWSLRRARRPLDGRGAELTREVLDGVRLQKLSLTTALAPSLTEGPFGDIAVLRGPVQWGATTSHGGS